MTTDPSTLRHQQINPALFLAYQHASAAATMRASASRERVMGLIGCAGTANAQPLTRRRRAEVYDQLAQGEQRKADQIAAAREPTHASEPKPENLKGRAVASLAMSIPVEPNTSTLWPNVADEVWGTGD